MKTLDLNGTWTFKAIDRYRMLPPGHRRVTSWLKATVPGTVHTDLIAHHLISDPFFRMQENDVQWVENLQWLYRRTFVVAPSFLEEESIYLVAEGLDTFALIRINGRIVGRTANMFIPHQFAVRKYLWPGKNTIEILFDSPVIRSKELENTHGRLSVALESHRVYARKAQYSFGWDWGPKLTTSGIWRGIALEAFSGARLRDPFVNVISLDAEEAVVRVTADLQGRVGGRMDFCVTVGDGDLRSERRVPVRKKQVALTVRIPHPRLWWPNGYGDQPLYTAVLSLARDGEVIHELKVPFALRTVRLVREPDREGKSFILAVNGKRIFCKGADWIPCDTFLPRIPDSRYETLLRLAGEAHMNMIRVWGGGIYERDLFYELCDRLGLMVWQDFMFACGEYPEQPWFLKNVQSEAEIAVKQLRNHPSLVLWCGNNECEWIFCANNPGKRPNDMTGARIFRKVLPGVCRTLDGTRPYWRSSPFGTGSPNDESNGNHHQWKVWSQWVDFREYEKDHGRFVTEFGFQAPATVRTMESCTLPEDRLPQGKVMEHHNKQVEGTERLIRFIAGHYLVDTDFDRFTYLGQLLQAEALKCAVEHWRRRKYYTAGALFWQLNDCWPVTSWSVIDSGLRPKAAYFYAKRFFAPILVSFSRRGSQLEVWVTNDTDTEVAGTLTVDCRSFAGEMVSIDRADVTVGRDASQRLLVLDESVLQHVQRDRQYFHAQLQVEGGVVAENREFLEEPKHLLLPEPEIQLDFREESDGCVVLRVSAKRFLRDLEVDVEGTDALFDDNYVDVDPGSTRDIRIRSAFPLPRLKTKIRLRWLR